MNVNFISFKNSDDVCTLHLVSDTVKIMIAYNTNRNINDTFQTILTKYQQGLDTSIKISDLVFICIEEARYIFHKISLNRGGSYIDTPKLIKYKEATTIPPQKKNKKINKK